MNRINLSVVQARAFAEKLIKYADNVENNTDPHASACFYPAHLNGVTFDLTIRVVKDTPYTTPILNRN